MFQCGELLVLAFWRAVQSADLSAVLSVLEERGDFANGGRYSTSTKVDRQSRAIQANTGQ